MCVNQPYLQCQYLQSRGRNSHQFVHSFTDKELDDALGLYYFEARWYNPSIGRFVSGDPAQMDSRLPGKLIYDPQSLNYYAYSRNNPIVYVDPSGEFIQFAIAALAGGLISMGAQIAVNHSLGSETSAGQLAGSFISGAIGGLSGPIKTISSAILLGAVGGVAGETAQEVIDNGTISGGELLTEGTIGAVTNAIPGPDIPGLTSGKGSMEAVTNQVETKLYNGTIGNITSSTGTQMMISNTMNSTTGEFASGSYSIYSVSRGDTLSSLFGNNWQTVAADNNIKDPNVIHVGQELKVRDSF